MSTAPLYPSIVDEQLADIEEVAAATPVAVIELAASLGIFGWPERAYREQRNGRPLWVHQYARSAA